MLLREGFRIVNFPGEVSGRVTPVPIPNTEVKPSSADGTALVTKWESRESPGLHIKGRQQWRPFFYIGALFGDGCLACGARAVPGGVGGPVASGWAGACCAFGGAHVLTSESP